MKTFYRAPNTIDHIGDDGLKVTEGVVTRIGRGAEADHRQVGEREDGDLFRDGSRGGRGRERPQSDGDRQHDSHRLLLDDGGRKVAHVVKKTFSRP